MKHLDDARWIGRGRMARATRPAGADAGAVFLDITRGDSYTVGERRRIFHWFSIGWNDHGNKKHKRVVSA